MDQYQSTLDYLFNSLPMYQRQGQAAYKPGIGNIIELCDILDQPQNSFPSIHIAGTNGKGSTAHLLSSILQEAGYKVGLYTSPHLVDFRERVKINGKPISKEAVISFVNQYKVAFETLNTSFFEWTVALAFKHFKNEDIDIAIIETGLGGRLDSTNIIKPLIAVITNIGLDHVQFLGNTLDKIAFEKAGIIKANTPVVIGKYQEETAPVFEKKAKEENAPLIKAYKSKYNYTTTLEASYQKENISTAITTIKTLVNITDQFLINASAIEAGIKNISINSGLKGRFDRINEKPLTFCDCAHNEDGLKLIFHQIENYMYQDLHLVYGTVNDKDVSNIVKQIPTNAKLYLCAADIPRSMPVKELTSYFKHQSNISYNSVAEAYQNALNNAQENDLILIAGSTFIVSDLYSYLENET
jgi:dihydrofolate synthase/folylpolyglutamate synthase